MKNLFSNIRFYILLFSISLSIITIIIPSTSYQLTKIFAFFAVGFLYLALLVGPATYIFTWLPFRGQMIKARRAIGVSAFYFAFLHMLSALNYLGGITTILSLPLQQQIPFMFGSIALDILFLMAITSSDKAVRIMTFPRWKFLHRFVYLAQVLIALHVFLIGKDFAQKFSPIPILTYIAILLLTTLQILAIFKHKQQQIPQIQT